MTRSKSLLVVTFALLAVLATSSVAFAAINWWCGEDPGAGNACAAVVNKPHWINPGYQWHVYFDVGLSNTLCVEYGRSGTFAEDTNPCVWGGDRADHWVCTTDAYNYINETDAKFQFFKSTGEATCSGTRTEFSGVQTFNTGANAITLQSLSATASALPLAGAAIATLGGLGGLALWRRRR